MTFEGTPELVHNPSVYQSRKGRGERNSAGYFPGEGANGRFSNPDDVVGVENVETGVGDLEEANNLGLIPFRVFLLFAGTGEGDADDIFVVGGVYGHGLLGAKGKEPDTGVRGPITAPAPVPIAELLYISIVRF